MKKILNILGLPLTILLSIPLIVDLVSLLTNFLNLHITDLRLSAKIDAIVVGVSLPSIIIAFFLSTNYLIEGAVAYFKASKGQKWEAPRKQTKKLLLRGTIGIVISFYLILSSFY